MGGGQIIRIDCREMACMVVGGYDTLRIDLGEMTEWLMVPTWNVGFVKANGGSNPPLSESNKSCSRSPHIRF